MTNEEALKEELLAANQRVLAELEETKAVLDGLYIEIKHQTLNGGIEKLRRALISLFM